MNVADGNFLYSTDLATDWGETDGFSFPAFYNSQETGRPGDLGVGWSWGEGPDVVLQGAGSDPTTLTLVGPSEFSVTFTSQSGGTFSSSSPDYALTAANLGSTTGSTKFAVTDEVGNVLNFNESGTETTLTDGSTGVVTTLTDSTTDAPGTNLDTASATVGSTKVGARLTYASSPSEVTKVADPYLLDNSTQQAAITYNSTEDLTAIRPATGSPTPPSGTTGEFIYAYTSGLMTSITEPNGTSEQITYTSGRVSELSLSSGGATSGYTFSYQSPNTTICASDDVGETIVTPLSPSTDPTITYCYTSAGVVDATDDPADVDTPPAGDAGGVIMFSGPLYDDASAGTAVGTGSTYLSADVSALSSSVGIQSSELLIDGVDSNPSADHFTQSCTTGCAMYADFAIDTTDLSAGTHTATVNVKSSDGHTSSQSFTFTVNPLETTDDTIPTRAEVAAAMEPADSSTTLNWGAGVAYAYKWRDSYNTAQYQTQKDDCTDYVSQILYAAGIPSVVYKGSGPGAYMDWEGGLGGDTLQWDNSSDLVHWALMYGLAENLHASFSWKPGDVIAYAWHGDTGQSAISHVQFVDEVRGGQPYMLQHSVFYAAPTSWDAVQSLIAGAKENPDWWLHLRFVTTQWSLSPNAFPQN